MAGKRDTLENRFLSKFIKTDFCWVWNGNKNNHGYGMIRPNGTLPKKLAHRVSYELYHGPIPDGMIVLHKCDNPACVNPEHLECGTMLLNTKDMISKGRSKFLNPNIGSKNGSSKFTEEQILEIRKRLENGDTRRNISLEYKVLKSTIRDIHIRKTWKHI